MLAMDDIRPKRGAITDYTKRAPYRGPPNERAQVDEPGAWHILTITPGQEARAMRHLAGRGYGVYFPERRALVSETGVEACHPAPLLPGYCMAFLWPSEAYRVLRCPGVVRIMSRASGVLEAVSDAELDRLRGLESTIDNALARHLSKIEISSQTRKPRRRRRSRRGRL